VNLNDLSLVVNRLFGRMDAWLANTWEAVPGVRDVARVAHDAPATRENLPRGQGGVWPVLFEEK